MIKANPFQVQTFSGELFDLQHPSPNKIHLDDIAIGLSRINRFNGQTSQPFTVADHSVAIARYVAKRHGTEFALAALLHDAHEAYLGDIVRPMENAIHAECSTLDESPIHSLKDRLDSAISARFGLPMVTLGFNHPHIKRADVVALAVEQKKLFSKRFDWCLPPIDLDEEAEMIECFNHSITARWESSASQFRETFAIYREK